MEMVLICPKCDKNNKLTAKYCCICAAKLENVSPQPAPVRLTCTSCGSVNKPGAKFCYKCATPLAEDVPPVKEDAIPFDEGATAIKEDALPPTEICCPDGHANKPGARFCRVCGKQIVDAAPDAGASAGAAAEGPAGGVACTCGHTNKPGAKFCARCGRDLRVGDDAPIDGFWYIL